MGRIKNPSKRAFFLSFFLLCSTLIQAGQIRESFNFALLSNYLWRGQGLSNQQAAIQGGATLFHSTGLYGGAWTSNFTDGSEIDLYFGHQFSPSFLPELISHMDLRLTHYQFPMSTRNNFTELSLSLDLWGFDVAFIYFNKFFVYETTGEYLSIGRKVFLNKKHLFLEPQIGFLFFEKDNVENYIHYDLALKKIYLETEFALTLSLSNQAENELLSSFSIMKNF